MPKTIRPQTVLQIVKSGNYNPEDRKFIYKLQELQIKSLETMRNATHARVIKLARKTYDLAAFYLVKDFSYDEELMFSKSDTKRMANDEIGRLHKQCKAQEPEMAFNCCSIADLKIFTSKVSHNAAKYLGFEAKVLSSICNKTHQFGESIKDLNGYRNLAAKLLAGSKGLPS